MDPDPKIKKIRNFYIKDPTGYKIQKHSGVASLPLKQSSTILVEYISGAVNQFFSFDFFPGLNVVFLRFMQNTVVFREIYYYHVKIFARHCENYVF